MNFNPLSINFLKHSQRIITEDFYNDKLLLLDRKYETVLQSTFEADYLSSLEAGDKCFFGA